MENKKYILYLLVVFCVCFILVGYFNYEKIINFFNSKEWEFVESFATLNVENISQVESGKLLLVLDNNNLALYDNEIKYSENLVTTGLITNFSNDYMVTVSKDTNAIYLFKEYELLWKNNFNWNIMNVSVNKNGYVTVIYSQSGYKSSIKIFKPSGEEMFTTYLASTYALDAEMSNDNKMLYIAEIDTEGIKLKSNIKVIEITNIEPGITSTPKVETILTRTDTLITDIEYSDINKLHVLMDSEIVGIDTENQVNDIGLYEPKNTLFAVVGNSKYPTIIEKKSTGIFTNETNLKIYKEDEIIEVNIDKTPQNVDVLNDKIALNLGDEVLFLNTNGDVEKRYELEKQLVSVKLYEDGKKAALIFRDKIELLKI